MYVSFLLSFAFLLFLQNVFKYGRGAQLKLVFKCDTPKIFDDIENACHSISE